MTDNLSLIETIGPPHIPYGPESNVEVTRRWAMTAATSKPPERIRLESGLVLRGGGFLL